MHYENTPHRAIRQGGSRAKLREGPSVGQSDGKARAGRDSKKGEKVTRPGVPFPP